jgi:hypothetical protein
LLRQAGLLALSLAHEHTGDQLEDRRGPVGLPLFLFSRPAWQTLLRLHLCSDPVQKMKIIDPLKNAFQQFSGQAVEAKLDDYTAVYGEVLLGMHREITSLRTSFDTLQEETGRRLQEARETSASAQAAAVDLEQRLAALESRLTALQQEGAIPDPKSTSLRLVYLLSLGAFLLSVLAMLAGGVSWILR